MGAPPPPLQSLMGISDELFFDPTTDDSSDPQINKWISDLLADMKFQYVRVPDVDYTINRIVEVIYKQVHPEGLMYERSQITVKSALNKMAKRLTQKSIGLTEGNNKRLITAFYILKHLLNNNIISENTKLNKLDVELYQGRLSPENLGMEMKKNVSSSAASTGVPSRSLRQMTGTAASSSGYNVGPVATTPQAKTKGRPRN
jgi:hypothetical protein